MAFDIHDTRTNPYALAVSVIASAFALGNIGLGAVLLAEPQRVTGPSFLWVLHRAPPQAWGAAFLLCGIVALIGQYGHWKWPARLAHTGSSLLCAYWVGAFLWAAQHSETSGLTGVVAYSLIGVTHMLIAVFSPHGPR